MTDSEMLRDIHAALNDPAHALQLIRAYYQDGDRADRTDRSVLYLHLGMLTGLLDRLIAHADTEDR